MENLVFIHLRRELHDIYYYKTTKGYEVDFFLPKKNMFIQVTTDLNASTTKEREVRVLVEASAEQKGATLIIVTQNEKQTITKDGVNINVVPLYEWLIQNRS